MSLTQLPGERLRAGEFPPDELDPRGGHLEVRGLSAAYGSSVVLRNVTLEAKPGEVVCILGRNGAGKTSLIHSIIGIMPSARETILPIQSRLCSSGMLAALSVQTPRPLLTTGRICPPIPKLSASPQ